MRVILAAILTVVLSFVLSLQAFAVPGYKAYDLFPPGSSFSGILKTNNSGEVIAQEFESDGNYKVFLWNPITQTSRAQVKVGSYRVETYAMNDLGQSIGTTNTASGHMYWYLWTPGADIIDIETVLGINGEIYDINNSSQIVGSAKFAGLDEKHAFLWSSTDGVIDLGALGGMNSVAFGVNDLGQVVGYYGVEGGRRAFIWDKENGMRDIGTLGGSNTEAFAINNKGQVVGTTSIIEDGKPKRIVFLWDSVSGMRPILEQGGFEQYTPLAINDNGTVVGFGPGQYGWIWDENTGQNILGEGYAYDINNSGWITARLTEEGGDVLLVPVPEPSSLAALILGLGPLGIGLIRRKR